MLPLLIALTLIAGKCGPAGCPSPQAMAAPVYAPPVYAAKWDAVPFVHEWGPREGRVYRWVSVVQGGATVEKWGWSYNGTLYFHDGDQPAAIAARRPAETPKRPETPPRANIEPPTAPDAVPPATPPAGQLPKPLTGVDSSQLGRHAGKESFDTTGEKARRFVEDVQGRPTVEDDSGKPFLTVIGSPEDTRHVMDAIKGQGELGAIAKHMHVHEYRDDSPYITGIGFPTRGSPMIYVQAPGGKVLHQQRDFVGGESKLIYAIEKSGALRKPNPHFDPDKVPDVRHEAAGMSTVLMVALGVAAAAVLIPTKKPTP